MYNVGGDQNGVTAVADLIRNILLLQGGDDFATIAFGQIGKQYRIHRLFGPEETTDDQGDKQSNANDPSKL